MNRKTRKEYKKLPAGFYHLCLDRLEDPRFNGSDLKPLLFQDEDDYRNGMAAIALSTLRFGVECYAFELMPNHLHDILYGTGEQCMKVFSYLKRRFSEQMIKKGFPALPRDYGCKLIPVEDDESLRSQILYTVRNPYEKGFCGPGGHRWGSGYLYFNELADSIRGDKVDSLHTTLLRKLTGTREDLPPDWEIHSNLGILPRNFVRVKEVERLFSSAKEYQTRLVKEYETVVKIARTLDDEVEFSAAEVREIANTELRNTYPGRLFKNITLEEKCRVAVRLNERLGLAPVQLAQALYLSELTVSQAIRSKDYGIRPQPRF
ncbi:MAG: hypothetical protein IK008_04745 [Bacteroidales bacterium]|nr:hypothetical protein [Bacteroidales bacterium]